MNRKLLTIFALNFGLAHAVTLYITFLSAWFNDMKTIVYINKLNEANIEMIIIPITIIIMFIALISEIARAEGL